MTVATAASFPDDFDDVVRPDADWWKQVGPNVYDEVPENRPEWFKKKIAEIESRYHPHRSRSIPIDPDALLSSSPSWGTTWVTNAYLADLHRTEALMRFQRELMANFKPPPFNPDRLFVDEAAHLITHHGSMSPHVIGLCLASLVKLSPTNDLVDSVAREFDGSGDPSDL